MHSSKTQKPAKTTAMTTMMAATASSATKRRQNSSAANNKSTCNEEMPLAKFLSSCLCHYVCAMHASAAALILAASAHQILKIPMPNLVELVWPYTYNQNNRKILEHLRRATATAISTNKNPILLHASAHQLSAKSRTRRAQLSFIYIQITMHTCMRSKEIAFRAKP